MSIEERLLQIPQEQVKVMRKNVLNLIPGLIYADPRSLKDAFDVSVQAVIDKVTRLGKNMIEGRTEYDKFVEENSCRNRKDNGKLVDTCGPRSSSGEDSSSSDGDGGTAISADAAKNSVINVAAISPRVSSSKRWLTIN